MIVVRVLRKKMSLVQSSRMEIPLILAWNHCVSFVRDVLCLSRDHINLPNRYYARYVAHECNLELRLPGQMMVRFL